MALKPGETVTLMAYNFLGDLEAEVHCGGVFRLAQAAKRPKKKSQTEVFCCFMDDRNRYVGGAALDPRHDNSRMIFTLSKLRNGRFVKVAGKSVKPLENGDPRFSTYAARFRKVGGKICRMKARFPGDSNHSASSDSQRFSCKNGAPFQ